MSYIPDTRYKMVPPYFEGTWGDKKEEHKDNAYWQGYLGENDSKWVAGYDQAIDDMLNMFNNMECFEEYLEAMGLDVEDMIQPDDVPDLETCAEEPIYNLSDNLLSEMTYEVRVQIGFMQMLMHWMENERDELITGILDNDEDYEEHVKNVRDYGYKNAVIRRIENIKELRGLSEEDTIKDYGDYQI